jgi:CMP-N,N'-diacetyllegionaminic acid synthase
VIFFVPARKGSQRVNGKNTRNVGGKPLVEWTFDRIDQTRESGDTVLVSTDDPEVLKLATAHNFPAVTRHPDFCGSTAKMSDVIDSHFQNTIGDDAVCVLYPTSPLRTAAHIRTARAEWKARCGNDAVLMSVCPVYHRPYGLLGLRQDGHVEFRRPDGRDFYQQQNMPVDYRANGAIYIIPLVLIRTRAIDAQLFGPRTLAFLMSEEESVEVDTEQDLLVTDMLMKNRMNSGVEA